MDKTDVPACILHYGHAERTCGEFGRIYWQILHKKGQIKMVRMKPVKHHGRSPKAVCSKLAEVIWVFICRKIALQQLFSFVTVTLTMPAAGCFCEADTTPTDLLERGK